MALMRALALLTIVWGTLSTSGSAQVFPIVLPAHVIVDSCSGCGGSGTVGQAAMAASAPVVIASDQSAVHIVCDSGCGSPPATADGTAFIAGTTNVSPMGALVDDVASTTVAENAYGLPRMSGARVLYVDLKQTSANTTAIKVDGSAATQPVSGTFWQATQPVSGTFWQATQPVSGTFWQATQPVSGTFWQATQPVSLASVPSHDVTNAGTFSVQVSSAPSTAVTNAGTFAVQATGTVTANQGGTWTVQPGNTANTTAWKVDGSAVTQPVSGTVTANQGGTWTVQPGNTANTTAWKVDGSAVTQPVSNAGLTNIDVALSTRLKPADTLTGVTTVATVTNLATIGTSVTPGTAAANLGKAEDAQHTSGDTGVMNLGVRQDTTSTAITSAAGDYSPYAVDAFGAQYTRSDSPNRVKCFIDSSATTSTVVTGCSAPGAGLSIYVTDISFYASVVSTTANRNVVQSGTGGTCGTATAILWAGYSPQIFSGSEVHLSTPLRAGTISEICFLNATAGQKAVTISGFIAP